MPWKVTSVTDQRVKFMLDYNERVRTEQTTMFALCAEHGVSRKTGYKIVARYQESGWRGLADHSRAPLGGKHWISSETISAVLDVRLDFPQWGSRKIVAYLRDTEPDQQWPAASVVHELIKKAGMVINDRGRLVQPLHHLLSGSECDNLRANLARVRETLSRVRVTRRHAVRQRNAVLVQLG